MALGNQVKTEPLSTTYTYEAYPLGSTFLQHASDVAVEAGNSGVSTTVSFGLLQGDREWVFVYAKELISAGFLCEWDFDHGIAYSIEPATTTDQIIQTLAGVADNAIAAGSYGWICKKGTVVVWAHGDVAGVGEPLASQGADGQVDDDGAAGTCLGMSLEAEGGTLASYAQAYINIP